MNELKKQNVKLVKRSMVIPENMETGLIRKRLIDSGNDICIRAGKNLPTKEINIIQRNVINTKKDWRATMNDNPNECKEEMAGLFISGLYDYQVGLESDKRKPYLLAMLECVLTLVGGEVTKVFSQRNLDIKKVKTMQNAIKASTQIETEVIINPNPYNLKEWIYSGGSVYSMNEKNAIKKATKLGYI